MLTWDNAITTAQNLTSDTTQDTFLKLMMNYGYKVILSDLGRSLTERTQTTDTVASQQYYQVPPDFLFTKMVTITVGSVVYPLIEIESQEYWEYLNQTSQTGDIPEYFYIRRRFGIGGDEIGIYPIPSSDGNTITITYEATAKDLSAAAYTTGTATATNGSASIKGSGTTWTSAMIDRYFQMTATGTDGMWYRITARSSNTAITLENVYEGTTLSGTYTISEMFMLPEDLHMLPVDYACYRYFQMRKNKDKAQEHFALFEKGMLDAKRRYGTKSRGNILRKKVPFGRGYPSHFPQSITS